MALVQSVKRGATKDVGDRVMTTTNTGTTSYTSANNGQTITDQTFTNSSGRVLSISGASNITFDHCTFENVANSIGVNGGYRYGLILISNCTNITFTNCKFDNFANTSFQQYRNDMCHVLASSGILFTESLINDVNSDHTIGSYSSGDEGNRTFFVGSGSTGFKATYCTFVNGGRNLAQFDAVPSMADSGIQYCVWLEGTEAEDIINHYNGGATSGGGLYHHYNYLHTGSATGGSSTGTILGDGSSGADPQNVWVKDSIYINTGDVGINVAGGDFNEVTDNIIFASTSPQSDGVGLAINNFGYVQSTDSNTITGNRVSFTNLTGRNDFWQGSGHTNTTWSNNTSDNTLTLTDLEDVVAVNDSISVTTGVAMTPHEIADTDESYFRDDTYTIVGGSLPTGLSMSSAGVISGTPTGSTSTITYQVENRLGSTDTGTVQVAVSGGTAFTISNPSDGSADVSSPVTFTGAGDNAWNVETRLENVTDSEVWDGSAEVPDTDSTANWISQTMSGGTWSQGPITLQPGKSYRYRARRWG